MNYLSISNFCHIALPSIYTYNNEPLLIYSFHNDQEEIIANLKSSLAVHPLMMEMMRVRSVDHSQKRPHSYEVQKINGPFSAALKRESVVPSLSKFSKMK
jgi:hypothetical protein